MSNEGTAEVGTEEPTQEGIAEVISMEEFKQMAKKAGWKEDGPLDAKTFIAGMGDRFHENSQSTKQMKKMVEGMTRHFAKTVEIQVNEKLAQLDSERDKAIVAGDVNAVKEIDKAIEKAKKTEIPGAEIERPAVQEFVNRNAAWFEKDPEMTEAAVAFNKGYLSKHPTADDSEILDHVERKMKAAFPDYFKVETKEDPKPPSGVESPTQSGGKSEPWQKFESMMTSFEKGQMEDMLKQTHNGKPITTKKAFVESLMAVGAFEGRK
jgi:hypothetical protein